MRARKQQRMDMSSARWARPAWWHAALAAGLLAGCGGGDGGGLAAGEAPAAATERAAAVLAAEAYADAELADATPDTCAKRVNNTREKLLQCVTYTGVRVHQQALQRIADDHGGHRAAGSPGFDASVRYAVKVFSDAGYRVTLQPFDFVDFRENRPALLRQVAPGLRTLETNGMSYSGSGDVTAAVSTPAGSPLGCTAADFAGFAAGNIALIRRGECPFADKAANAAAAGAAGVVIYNNIDAPLNGTLGDAFKPDLPVTSVTLAEGERLAGTSGLRLRLRVDAVRETVITHNVLAESRQGDPDKVVVIGAHLDSVHEGPGINDNGSGSATILEVAKQMARVRPVNRVRFALWSAEEAGLVGSDRYVSSLSEADLSRIALYLNFDMIGSPNHVFFVYDGNNSDAVGAGPGPAGSADIERVFERFYRERGLPFKGTDFDGRSDYGPFIAAGIPAGGLFTGAEGVKTEAEARLWGGTAGRAYDPCYHQRCDTFNNNNGFALKTNADAVAFATLKFAMAGVLPGDARSRANATAAAASVGAPRKPLQGPRDAY